MRVAFATFISLALPCLSLADDWPQWLGPQRDAVWREANIIEKFPDAGPRIAWRVPVGSGYSGPSVAGGRVYLTDRQLKPGASNPADPFARGRIDGNERVICFDEKTGRELWRHEYDAPYTISYAAGPRAHPLVDGGHVFTLGAEGNLIAFDAVSGKVQWSLDFNDAFSIPTPLWGFSAHPLVDGQKLICLAGGPGSVAVAFDKATGKELWRSLSAKEPGYAPPTIVQLDGKRQLIIWHPQSVNSLDPETGKANWSHPWNINNALTISTPRVWNNDHLFLTAFYNGSLLLKPNSAQTAVETVWQSRKISEKDTDKLHSIMSTPFIDGNEIFGVCSYGQLRALDARSGERLWEDLSAATPDQKPARWANAFIVRNGDRFFLANEKGELIIARLSRDGYTEISRATILKPTGTAAGRDVVWSHPAFANGHLFARNDQELVCVDLRR